MRNRVVRTALAATIGFISAAVIPSTASATITSINTSVSGGSAGIDGTVGSIDGSITFVNSAHYTVTEAAAIGRIRLTGKDQENNLASLPVYCVDVENWLGNGTFTKTTLSALTTSQISNVVKFLVYADPLVNNAVTSAAAQLGVWEILNESAAAWNVGTGNFTVSYYNNAAINAAAAQANTWLNLLASGTLTTGANTLTILDPGRGNQVQAFVSPTGSTGSVPEPATWAMMVMGFGALGAALRRRQEPGALFA